MQLIIVINSCYEQQKQLKMLEAYLFLAGSDVNIGNIFAAQPHLKKLNVWKIDFKLKRVREGPSNLAGKN